MSEADRILALTPADVQGPTSLPPAVCAEDLQWLTLCVYQEARGEPADGRAAVAQVVINRARHEPPYASDGTIQGTVFWADQFSWTSWAMAGGHYIKVARSDAEVAARAAKLLAASVADTSTWAACDAVVRAVLGGVYAGGAAFQALGADALLYCNLAISRPAWADPARLIAKIGRHSFFRA